MTLAPFKLEEYLGKYEFSAPYLLCCSDPESFSMQEILSLCDAQDKKIWDELKLGYTEIPGLPILREQIAKSLYPSLTYNNIFCFAGAEEGIFCSLYSLCQPEDHVIILAPCYQSLMELPKLKGSSITSVMLREENDWRIDIRAIEKAISPNTKWLIINFPHNPTGQVITKEELEALVKLCDKHGIWIFADEVFRLLGSPNEPWAPNVAEIYPKSISLGVMSKAYGLAGLRVGWIASQDKEILKKIEHFKHYTTICNSAPAEILSLIALKNKDKILARNNEIVVKNLTLLDEFMDKYQDLFEWVRPQGGCIGYVKYKSDEPISSMADRLVKAKGVLLMPANIYDHDSNHFRIGFGRKNMEESLLLFKEFLNI